MAKISLDPMPDAREAAVARINAHFAHMAATDGPREQAWRRKREVATAVAAGGEGTFFFAQDAGRAGMTVAEFAGFILAKQDPAEIADAREDARQAALHAVEAATSPDELHAIAAAP
jgi:hypothetical protein